jgi:beta-lactamase regulating signal transducer with metallopeptidase domain
MATAPLLPTQATRSASSRSWPVWIFAAWLAGVTFLAGQVVFSSLRLWRRSAKLRPLTHQATIAALDDCCRQLKVRTRPALLESLEVKSPALHGLFRPRLLLPKGFVEQFSLEELRFVFLHELAHLKRRDLLVNWVMAALQIIHWFNPVVWFGFGRWRADREVACDAIALEAAGQEQNKLYGLTILRLLENFSRPVSTPGLVGILEDKRQLHLRIHMIANYAPAGKWPVLALLLATGLAAIGLTDARNHSTDGVATLVASGAAAGANAGSRLTILVTNHDAWSGVVRYRTGAQKQAEGVAQGYTNSPQLRDILGLLKNPEALRFTPLDCWDAVVQAMPTGLTLETMNFTGGTKLDLTGTIPSGQVPIIIDFYDKLRKAEKNGTPLFETNARGPVTQMSPGSATVRWNIHLDLSEGTPTAANLDSQKSAPALAGHTGYSLTILATNNPGGPWAAGYLVALEESAPAAPATSDLANRLIGAWVLVGTPDKVGPVPTEGGRIKFYTGKYFCITECDPKNNVVVFHHGGTYTINGNESAETIQYANPTTMSLIGKSAGHFKMNIDGDTLTQIGIDNEFKEVWKKRTGGAGFHSDIARKMTGLWIRTQSDLTDSTSGTTLKFITPTDWCFTESDAKTGVVTFHFGGTCAFDGNEYDESVKYSNPGTMHMIGEENRFTSKLDGNTLTTTGIGNPWNEVWKRVK